MAQGEFALVRDNLDRALHKSGEVAAKSDLYAMLADAVAQQRDQDALREYAPLLEETATSLEHKLYLATAHRAWGVLHRMEGEFEDAEARLEKAEALFSGLGARWQLGRTYFELGELETARIETAVARQHFNSALDLFEEMGALPDSARTIEKLKRLS